MTWLFTLSNRATIAIVAVIGALMLLVGLGWWGPNAEAWQACGASKTFSAMRGIFEKPDAFTCLALMRETGQ